MAKKKPQPSDEAGRLEAKLEAEKKKEEKEEKLPKLDKEKRVKILKQFTNEVLKLHGPIIRSIVLFGSTARHQFKGESDIDVFIILDDTKQNISIPMKERIEDDIEYIAKKCSPLLSVQQPYLLTEFWAMVRIGHPIVFNFIREGVAIYDKDIFLPIKKLLQMGEIKPSKEAVESYIERGPKRIRRVENAKMYMVVEDLYYAMLESAQAVLMFLGKDPPRPGDAPEVLRKTLIPMKLMKEEEVKDLEAIIELRKKVEHKQIKTVSGADLDLWITKSDAFVKKMQKLIVKIEVLKRENMVERSYAIMAETTLALLKALDKTPKKGEPIKEAFKKNLVDCGMIEQKYLDVFNELERFKDNVRKGKILDIEKENILMHREYVRKFIREASRILKKKCGQSIQGE